MNLTEEVIRDLFPHSEIENQSTGYKIKTPWCLVIIHRDSASLQLKEVYDHPQNN